MSDKKKEIFNDERFAHLLKNPRFTKLPKSKVKIDERFKSKLKEESFATQPTTDKYGRRSNKSTSEELKKYYELSSSDESDGDENIEGNASIKGDNVIPEKLKDKIKNLEIDYLRGEGVIQSDSSDEGSSSEEDLTVEHEWGQLDQDAERTEESTKRIALMHMDWDRIRAIDIMILCNSFIPTGTGSILSVNIYPSEFGKERMKEEEMNGPKELTTISNDDHDAVDEESEEYREKVRQYQLNRLKYFYAVVEFDSVTVADIFYKECDGLEYESTANRLDLRFIPDDMKFDDEPKDTCTELPDLSTLAYEPRMFFTSALQHANVELTWDETDVSRKEISEKLFTDRKNEIPDHELKKFVACSSESEEENSPEGPINEASNSKNSIELYKSLLSEIQDKEEDKRKKQMEMEYSWSIGGGGGGNKAKIENEIAEITPFEKIIEKKKQKSKLKKLARTGNEKSKEKDGYSSSDFDDIDMNDPFFAEEFQNDEFEKPKKKKNKNRKKLMRDESPETLNAKNDLELLLDDNNDAKSHFSLKEIQKNEEITSKKKKKLKKMKKGDDTMNDNFELNVADSRFSAVFSNPEFNIDPTDPHFKKTKGMEKLIEEKLKRRYNSSNSGAQVSKKLKH